MTKQAGMPSSDPIDALVEIMETADKRMSTTSAMDSYEAYTLGLIMGIAWRNPIAVERFKTRQEAKNGE